MMFLRRRNIIICSVEIGHQSPNGVAHAKPGVTKLILKLTTVPALSYMEC